MGGAIDASLHREAQAIGLRHCDFERKKNAEQPENKVVLHYRTRHEPSNEACRGVSGGAL